MISASDPDRIANPDRKTRRLVTFFTNKFVDTFLKRILGFERIADSEAKSVRLITISWGPPPRARTSVR